MKKIIIKRSRDHQYYFVVCSGNGQTIVTSETYTRKDSCREGIRSLTRLFVSTYTHGKPFSIIDQT